MPVLFDESCDSSAFSGESPVDPTRGRGVIIGSSGSVTLSCSTVAKGALRSWSSVREGERGPADSADAFKNGARVGGNKVPTGEYSSL